MPQIKSKPLANIPQLGLLYHVSRTNIKDIVRRNTWRHI